MHATLEAFSTVDLVADIYIIAQLASSSHIAWLTVNIQSVFWPFLVAYLPFIAFKLSKIDATKVESGGCFSLIKAFFRFLSVTPMLVIYLAFIDLFFMLMGLLYFPAAIILAIFSCGHYGAREVFECQNYLFIRLFEMNRMDVLGFRRLRTFSQLTFESITQIFIQGWIYYKLKTHDDLADEKEIKVSVEAIVFSMCTAVIHAILEIIMLVIEKWAYRSSMMHFSSVCLTGTFGWVPFTNLLRDTERGEVMDEGIKNHVFDYEDIGTRVCGIDFQYEFSFAGNTLQ